MTDEANAAIQGAASAGASRILVNDSHWLMRNLPEPRSPLVLCHGDSWGGNLLVEDGEVTGLIDWSGVGT